MFAITCILVRFLDSCQAEGKLESVGDPWKSKKDCITRHKEDLVYRPLLVCQYDKG